MGLTQRLGAAGESLAAAYLELVGCCLISRNQRFGGVEVDLLVGDREARVLVEVKYRGRSDYGGAALAVDHLKRRRLLKAAQALSAQGGGPVRIDVVSVELNADGATVRHYRNAVTE